MDHNKIHDFARPCFMYYNSHFVQRGTTDMEAPLYGTSLILGKIRKNQRPKMFSGEVRQIDLVSTFCFPLLANEEYPGWPPLLDCFIWRVNFNFSPQLVLHIREFIYARILSTSSHASDFCNHTLP